MGRLVKAFCAGLFTLAVANPVIAYDEAQIREMVCSKKVYTAENGSTPFTYRGAEYYKSEQYRDFSDAKRSLLSYNLVGDQGHDILILGYVDKKVIDSGKKEDIPVVPVKPGEEKSLEEILRRASSFNQLHFFKCQ